MLENSGIVSKCWADASSVRWEVDTRYIGLIEHSAGQRHHTLEACCNEVAQGSRGRLDGAEVSDDLTLPVDK